MKKLFLALALSIATSPIGSKAETIHLDSPTGHQCSAQHTISFNYGLSWIVSKVYDYRAYKNYRWRGGQELQTEYTCVFAQGLGFGLVGSFNWTEYPAAQITQLHVAPEFVFAHDLGDHWRVKASAGLGLAYYNDEAASHYGLGSHLSGGIEYKFTRHFGIGAELNSMSGNYGKSDYNDNEIDGFVRLNALVGVRFHF